MSETFPKPIRDLPEAEIPFLLIKPHIVAVQHKYNIFFLLIRIDKYPLKQNIFKFYDKLFQ
jgi:hypothetical protein